jgi:hypothetical protein
MRYPLALRTKRIVFLVALLCPSVTLAYIALPHGDDGLRNAKATARTQDIVIDSHALPTSRSLFMAGAANPLAAVTMPRTAADNAAIDELAYATALSGSALTAPALQRDSVSSSGGGGSSSNHNRRRGSASEAGFSSRGMGGGGVGWGGATGAAARQNVAANRVAGNRPVKQQAAKTDRPPRERRSASPSTPSSGGSSGRAEAEASASTAPVATLAALAPSGTEPVFSSASTTVNGVARVTTSTGTSGGSSPSPAPEPITLLLMGTGLAGAFAGRRFVH